MDFHIHVSYFLFAFFDPDFFLTTGFFVADFFFAVFLPKAFEKLSE